jgi:sigma-B regulation protein RsbU (phosphoserine phosphatase)
VETFCAEVQNYQAKIGLTDREVHLAQPDPGKQLDTLLELTRIFNSGLDLKAILQRIMECAKAVMGAEASSLLLWDRETRSLVWKSATGQVRDKVLKTFRHPMGTGIAGYVYEHGEPLAISDAYNDARFDPEMDRRTGFKTHSILCVPLKVRDHVLGVAEVINKIGENGIEPFTQEDLHFFVRICDSAAIAVENALLHDQLVREERRKRDLELAKEIQQSFLPRPPKDLDRLRVSLRNQAAQKVGGDFYEFASIGGDRYFFCIGDVSGKGVPAALYMARLLSDLRYLALSEVEPAKVLERVNQRFLEKSVSHMFVTLLAGTVETGSGRLILTNAGHNQPLILSEEDPAQALEVPTQLPLGLSPNVDFQSLETILLPGQSLFLYTDGLTEARNPEGEMLDIEGLRQYLDSQSTRGDRLLENIFAMVEAYEGDQPPMDDQTVFLLERF